MRGTRRRQQPRLDLDEGAGVHAGVATRRQANAKGRAGGLETVGCGDAKNEARAGAPEVDLLDEALHRRDARTLEHGRGEPRAAEARGRHTREDRRERQAEREGTAAVPQRGRAGGPRAGENRGETEHRLAIGLEVERDAGAEAHGQPQEETAVFAFQRPGRAEDRRQPGEARAETKVATFGTGAGDDRARGPRSPALGHAVLAPRRVRAAAVAP